MAYLNEPSPDMYWVTSPNLYKSGSDDPEGDPPVYYTELDEVSNYLLADFNESVTYTGDPIKYIVLPDTATELLPRNLSLDENSGHLSGELRDMDLYIPAYINETPPMTRDGRVYGTYGSTLHGDATAHFTVRAISSIGYVDQTFNMPIHNTYSSDRDQFLRIYSAANENTEGTYFMIGMVQVDVETYIQHWKDLGIFI